MAKVFNVKDASRRRLYSRIETIRLSNGNCLMEFHGPELAETNEETVWAPITRGNGEPMTQMGEIRRARDEAKKWGAEGIVFL